MAEAGKKFYVTTPIYYVNARPHIGHAYTTIVADVLARRHRLLGEDVFFLTGTDEHGQKIERSAAAAGVAPQAFADAVSASFSGLWQRMGITHDAFIRTTDPAHKRGAQQLFTTLHERGQIYLSSYTGQYSVGEEMFVEGPPGTLGPDGKPTETVTEENFFFRLSEYQVRLIDLIESGALAITPEARKNEVMSFLRGNVAQQPAAQTPGGVTYVPGALKDLSVSRSSFTWGIPVPEPAASEAKERHVIYVWLDALANYITALGYGSPEAEPLKRLWPAELQLVGKEIIRFHCVYWPAFLLAAGLELPKAVAAHGWLLFDDSKMSKSKGNIVRTETILDAFGDEVYGKQFPDSSKKDRDLFASDVLRYFLLREIPFGQDGSFSFDAMVTRYNADLVNGYGNLVSRTLNLIQQNFASDVPLAWEPWLLQPFEEEVSGSVLLHGGTAKLQLRCRELFESAATYLDRTITPQMFLSFAQLVIADVDYYFSRYKPWLLAKSEIKEDRRKLQEILYAATASIRMITGALYPVLPFATAAVWRQLGLGEIEEAAARGEWKDLEWGGLKPGTKLGALAPVFPRAEKGLATTMSDMEAMKSKPNAPLGANDAADANTATASEFPEGPIGSADGANKPSPSRFVDESFTASPQTPADPTHPAAGPRTGCGADAATSVAGSNALTTERPASPSHAEAQGSGIFAGKPASTAPDAATEIAIDDFAKVELRVAQVVVCERIPKADKLLRLEVDLGYERRQILSGIAEWYTPEELVGRRIVVITNLAPRKMRGLESHGMLLAASSEGGKPALATFLDADVLPLGSRLK